MEEKINLEEESLNEKITKAKQKIKSVKISEEVENTVSDKSFDDEELVNCLRKERVIVRHINKKRGSIDNPKHVLFGGMAETSVKTFTLPRLSSGIYVNPLTNAEKACLERIMQLEDNALSIYKKENNFWNSTNPNGVNRVRLSKQDNYFDLSDPEDYIRYKILLCNKNFICPSLKELEDRPKATYQFVVISEGEELNTDKQKMNYFVKATMELGKINDNADLLRAVIELLDGRPVAPSSNIDFLQTKAFDLLQANPKTFVQTVTDPHFATKALIKKAVTYNVIALRNDLLYLKKDNSPLCEFNEESTLNVAAVYLDNPKHQDVKFDIQAQLKNI